MIKKKFSKMKRFFAILGVVVILAAFALPFSAGAWEMTDIPFFNYLDNTRFLPSKDDGKNAYVVSTDINTGVIRCAFEYSGVHAYYVPWQYTRLSLRTLCPDMKVGETYVLSGELNYITDVENANKVELLQLIGADGAMVYQWRYGEAITVTPQMLDAYVVIFVANFKDGYAAPSLGDVITTELKLWINKGEAPQEFATYNIAKELSDAAYNSGLLDGMEAARANQYIVEDKTKIDIWYFNRETGDREIALSYDGDIPIAFTGYSLDTYSLSSRFSHIVSACSVTGTVDFEKSFYTGSVPLTVQWSYDVNTTLVVRYKDGNSVKLAGVTLGFVNNPDAEMGFKERVLILDWEKDLGLPLGTEIVGFSFDMPLNEGSGGVAYSGHGFKLSLADDGSYSFKQGELQGYKNGYANGVLEGNKEGYSTGYDDGYGEGFDEGFYVGGDEGYNEGYNVGYGVGVEDGTEVGYEKGHNKGYYEGIAKSDENITFYELIYAVVDAPVSVLSKTFNFNLMGVNMGDFFFGLVTFAATASLAIFILKLVK